jgi:hypothetical protein
MAAYKIKPSPSFEKERQELFGQLVDLALKDRSISADDERSLEHLRALLSLGSVTAHIVVAERAGELFKMFVGQTVSSGRLSAEGKASIDALAHDLKLSEESSKELYRQKAGDVLQAFLGSIISDQRVTPEEDRELKERAESLGFNLVLDDASRSIVDRYRRYWQIENGEIPEIRAGINLQRGERCYFTGSATWHEYRRVTRRIRYSGPTFRVRIAKGLYWRAGDLGVQRVSDDVLTIIDSGQLYLTSKRIIFVGGRKNATLALGRVLDFHPYKNGVDVEKDSGKSPFLGFSEGVDVFSMILGRLLRDAAE